MISLFWILMGFCWELQSLLHETKVDNCSGKASILQDWIFNSKSFFVWGCIQLLHKNESAKENKAPSVLPL